MEGSETEISEFLLEILGKLDPSAFTKQEIDFFCYNIENYYLFERKYYEKVNFFPDFTKLVNYSRGTKGFSLKQFEKDGEEFLGVFFIPHLYGVDARPLKVRYFIDNFFTVIEPCTRESTYQRNATAFTPPESPVETSFEVSLTGFYDKLKQAHDLEELDRSVDPQHPKLRPILRPYQINGIRWMLKRETQTEYLPTEFIRIANKNHPDQIFYYNERTLDILPFSPGNEVAIPQSGILADEMGLGKSVEILALILCNPRRMKRKLSDVEKEEALPAEQTFNPKNHQVECLCTNESKKKTVLCSICQTLQHVKCVMKNSVKKAVDYKCPACWKLVHQVIESSTTIICSPASIKQQWVDEINKHVRDENFKVLVYNGVSGSGWISPADLQEYDVIITDFNVLKNEIYYTNSMERNMRQEKRYIKPSSPLLFLNFWRVCLDEAQMVENPSNQCSKMVKTLKACHRWAVTGTPVENHISNVGGLLDFLDYYPYADPKIWKKLCNDFCFGQNENLIRVLEKIFWRTCKKNVIEELGIPPQTEIIHSVKMTDLHKFFYVTVHIQTEVEFRKNAQRICDEQETMFHMNHNTIRALLEPLRKLRQDCTIPSIFHKNAEAATVKQTLTPNELQDHLISNNEIECKAQLRTIASSLNGIAAIHAAKEEFPKAIQNYKLVIRWANDYTGTIHVDALLKIHALHNLAEIIEITQDENELKNRESYIQESNKLEWKYINNYFEKVKQIHDSVQEQTENIQEIRQELKLSDFNGDWWREILYSSEGTAKENLLMDRIRNDLLKMSGMEVQEEVRSVRGVDLILTTWWDKVNKHRNHVLQKFQELEFFSKNLKPAYLMSAEEREKVEHLIASAFECHLNLEEDEDGQQITSDDPCELCLLKEQLKSYEVLIFHMVLTEKATQGNWNPRVEENILRLIFTYAKKEKMDKKLLKSAETFLNYLEAFKNQFKELGQLWVEVNYCVSGCDEINMCKTRLQIVEPEEINENESKFSSKISKFEVEDTYATFEMQKAEAEKEFLRLNGRIKYLKYLKEKKEIQPCPICEQMPTDRYCVLECGHNLCLMCLTQMMKFNRVKMTCPVCRATQTSHDVYTVSCSAEESEGPGNVSIAGSWSSKIDEIVKCVLKLKAKEEDVKIIIFSHWDNILNVIGKALAANNITSRSNKGNFAKMIHEFKDYKEKVTCLLMNLKLGSKGLNLTEATHCFLVEPIINPAEELQAVGRIHRIGQTRPTFVHRFIVAETIEETIHNEIMKDYSKWKSKDITVKNLENLFLLNGERLQFQGLFSF